MKKRIILILFLLLISFTKVEALSLSENNLTLGVGESKYVEMSTKVEQNITSVKFDFIYTTYDIPANFVVNSNFTDNNPEGVTHTITLTEPQTGTISLGNINVRVKEGAKETNGSIIISNATATTTDGTTINLNPERIEVTVGESSNTEKVEEKEINKNLLDKIESKIVNIELKEDVFEYTITIKNDVEELDLKPIAKDNSTKIDITTQKISELKDNKITIKAKKGSTEQDYVINVKIKEEKEITIDKEEFKKDTSYKSKWIGVIVAFAIALTIGLILNKKK